MNLALQKRLEQLERWKQNEADVELKQQQTQADQAIQHQLSLTKTSTLSPTISRKNKRTSYNDSLTNSSFTTKGRNGKKHGTRDLQVKFSNSTLFLTACANGDLDECERLLDDESINIDVTTCDGLTGLHEAAICGNAELVEYLLEHGANINCCDNEGWTPLHAAASLGQVKIVQILLENGADATIVNCENLLAYDLARNDQVQALIGEHLQDVDIDQIRSQEESVIKKDIERWIKTGHYEERSHPVTNATVLHVLAAKGHLDLMKQILESPILKKQVNLEAKDNEGFTPLLAASFWSQKEIVELLIEHGANIFAQANNGYKISSIVAECAINFQENVIMSRNPYLAASRPTSSFTRSSRTSARRNEPSLNRGLALGRSRSSATLGGSLASHHLGSTSTYGSSASGYIPSWQRSLSSTRSSDSRQPIDSPTSKSSSSYKADDYTPSTQYQSRSYDRPLLYKTSSSQNLDLIIKDDCDDDDDDEVDKPNHLKNYQQSKLLNPPQLRPRSSVQSLDSDVSAGTKQTSSLDLSSTTDLSYEDSASIKSGSAPRHPKPQAHLLKSRSLEINQHQQQQNESTLPATMSLDRLLLRSETMSERELRKSYKELVMENESLKKQLKGIDESAKQKQQEWIRKERQMQRKISELEEESRQLEQWKQEIQHLKDENSSLIRVVTKLSKKN